MRPQMHRDATSGLLIVGVVFILSALVVSFGIDGIGIEPLSTADHSSFLPLALSLVGVYCILIALLPGPLLRALDDNDDDNAG